jgi:hypothetical protein
MPTPITNPDGTEKEVDPAEELKAEDGSSVIQQ